MACSLSIQDWRITSFNRAAEEITGVPRQEAIGRRVLGGVSVQYVRD
jgi:PAS domain-containing protein